MTDTDIIRAYRKHIGPKAELLGRLALEGEDLGRMVRVLSAAGARPMNALRHAWGTTRPEKIAPTQIRDWLIRRGALKSEPEKRPTTDRSCKGCIYYSQDYGTKVCNYYLQTGRRRGCPAGEGCDKRKLEKRRT